MKIEINPKETFSFEKVITPAVIKLVFFAGFAVKVLDAFVSLVRNFTGYALLNFFTGIVFYGITLFLSCQLLLALTQKFAPAPAPTPTPTPAEQPPAADKAP